MMAPCISVENIIKENEIFATFDYEDDRKLTSTLKLRKNMKFSEAASKYYKEMDIDEKEEKKFKFLFNSQNIDFNKTLDEIGIKNNSKISVLRSTYICGGELNIKSILEKLVNEDVSAEKKSGKKIHVSFEIMNGETFNTILKDDIMFAEVTMPFCEKYGALTGENKNIETDKVRFFLKEMK